MKRDMDLCRDILLEAEAGEPGRFISRLKCGRKHPDEVVAEHVALLAEGGLIEAKIQSTFDGRMYYIQRLTMAGHDWLDVARNPGIWSKGKERLAKAGIESASLSMVKEILLDLIRKTLV